MTKRKWRRATGDDTFDGYCLVEDGQDTPAVVSKIHHADGIHFMWYLIYDGEAISSHRDFALAKRDGARYHTAELQTAALEAAVVAIARLDARQLEVLGRVVADRKREIAFEAAAKRGKRAKRKAS